MHPAVMTIIANDRVQALIDAGAVTHHARPKPRFALPRLRRRRARARVLAA